MEASADKPPQNVTFVQNGEDSEGRLYLIQLCKPNYVSVNRQCLEPVRPKYALLKYLPNM